VPQAGHFTADLITPGPSLSSEAWPGQPVDTFFEGYIKSPTVRMLRRMRGR